MLLNLWNVWEWIFEDVKEYIKRCVICNTSKEMSRAQIIKIGSSVVRKLL